MLIHYPRIVSDADPPIETRIEPSITACGIYEAILGFAGLPGPTMAPIVGETCPSCIQASALAERKRTYAIQVHYEGTFHPKPSNWTEAVAFAALTQEGWEVCRRGFPDFMCTRMGQLLFVEVKRDNEHPTIDQWDVMIKLEQRGIPCFVWRPTTGFKRCGNPHGETVSCEPPIPRRL